MRKTIVLGLIGMCVVGTAIAQTSLNRSRKAEVKQIIEEVGGTCGEVVRNQDVGKIDNNTTLMAIACDGGDTERYVLVVDSRGNMQFYSTCEALAIANDNRVRCFS